MSHHHHYQGTTATTKSSSGIREVSTDSRSYGGMRTPSNYKPVTMDRPIKWPYVKRSKKQPKINIGNLRNEITRNECKENVSKNIKDAEKPTNALSK